METSTDLKHDFINQSLRIEIIQKLICECLEEKKEVEDQLYIDLKESLEKQLSILNSLHS